MKKFIYCMRGMFLVLLCMGFMCGCAGSKNQVIRETIEEISETYEEESKASEEETVSKEIDF